MIEQLNIQAISYFRPPKDTFWRWAEAVEIAEWQNGTTICYREELLTVLTGFVPTGLPALGAALLLLAACNQGVGLDELTLLRELVERMPSIATEGNNSRLKLRWQLRYADSLLTMVKALPAELRTGPVKLHLLREVLGPATPAVAAEASLYLLNEWTSGRLDAQLRPEQSRTESNGPLLEALLPLAEAGRRFNTPGSLELLLRTGLDQLPQPLPEASGHPLGNLIAAVALHQHAGPDIGPEPLPAAPSPADLLDQLAQDPRTAGLARLSQQLGAALRIPLHARGAGDQPVGGVADVSNRGSFDRLLLSELAHDDLTLMARLVNNEALYLRREAPPQPAVRPRAVLLDTTLRLWGVPRVFALAAALAWARNSRQGRPPVPVAALALGGQLATPLDLDTFEGVVAALGQLDPAPHAGPALLEVSRQPVAANDCLLITEAGLLHQPDFARALAAASSALRFLLTVDRSGELQLYEYHNGHRTLAGTARYELAELLFAAPRRPLHRRDAADEPAFWQYAPAPLYLPVTGLRMSIKNTFYAPETGVLAISDTGRVLLWADKSYGARELLPLMEPGSYCFGSDGQQAVYVLVSGPALLRVYAFRADAEPALVDLSSALNPGEAPAQVVFQAPCFHVRQTEGVLVFDCAQWCRRDGTTSLMPSFTPSGFRPNFGHLKRHVNSGYTVLQRVNRLEVNGLGELVVEGHELRLSSQVATLSHGLHLLDTTSAPRGTTHRVKATLASTQVLAANERVLLRHFSWPDGSTAVADTRGLLHLRSADASVPELALLLVLGKPTAAWAADGTVCGPPYFTGPAPARLLPVAEFYRQYLQPFIAHLGQGASQADVQS